MKAANFSQFFYVRYFHFILLYSRIYYIFMKETLYVDTFLFVFFRDFDGAPESKCKSFWNNGPK